MSGQDRTQSAAASASTLRGCLPRRGHDSGTRQWGQAWPHPWSHRAARTPGPSTVPQKGLEHFAVGLDDPMRALRNKLEQCAQGGSGYKFIRGPYGAGKTFLASLVGSEAFDKKYRIWKPCLFFLFPLKDTGPGASHNTGVT